MRTALILLLIAACQSLAGLGSNTFALKKKLHTDGARQLCISSVRGEQVGDEQAAFGLLYLGWENDTANKRLSTALETAGGDEKIHWRLRTYYLFGNSGQDYGKLDEKTKSRLAQYLRKYAQDNKPAAFELLDDVRLVKDGEAVDFARVCGLYLTMQLFMDSPDDKADYRRLNDYLLEYCKTRTGGGLWISGTSANTGQMIVCSLVNLYDFAQDELLKKRASIALDIFWADWAQDQRALTRCGARIDTAAPVAENDSLRLCVMPFVSPDMNWTDGRKYARQDSGFIYITATTLWRMNDVVMDMILDGGKGEYEYKSVYPASAQSPENGLVRIQSDEGMLTRYSYGTSEYIIGAFITDPSRRLDGGGYWHRLMKNCVQGLTLIGGDYMLIGADDGFVQAAGIKNIFIFHNIGKSALKMSVSGGLRGRLLERGGGRIVLNHGSTWAAVKGLSVERPGAGCDYQWTDDNTIVFEQSDSPVVMITASTAEYRQIDEFVEYITSHDWRIRDGVLTYSFTDDNDKAAVIQMRLDGSKQPMLNDKPLDLAGRMLYDGPYIRSLKGAGIITLAKDNRKVMYYLNQDEVVESK